MKSAVLDAYSGMINNIRLKGNHNIKIVCIDVRIKLKLILFHLFLFLQQNDTLGAILVVKFPILQSFYYELKCQKWCLLMFVPHVFLSPQNAKSINPAIQLSAVQAAR